MKNLLQYFIRKRNVNFAFDEHVTNRILLELFFSLFILRMRGFYYQIRLLTFNNLYIGRSLSLKFAHNILLGNNVKIGKYVTLSGLGKNKFKLNDNVSIGDFSSVIISTSFNNLGEYIEIDSNTAIGEFAYLGGGGGLKIGAECIVGQYFSCHPENHSYQLNELSFRHQPTTRKGIVIGRNCWIGSKVTILDGVEIGDNCVIAAGAVVTTSFPSNVVIGGVPAKLLKTITA